MQDINSGAMIWRCSALIEEYAKQINAMLITLEVAEGRLAEARKMMQEMIAGYMTNSSAFRK